MNEPNLNKHIIKNDLLFPGFNVHAKIITFAPAEGRGATPEEASVYVMIPNDLHKLESSIANLEMARPAAELPETNESRALQ